MHLKIMHTGDVHIGMKFNNYPDYLQDKLIEARYEVLNNIVNIGNDKNSNLLVISGDLFDKQNIKESNIIKVINILEGFSGDAILLLPGNHDFDNGGVELWQKFKNNMSGKMVLLNELKSYNLNKFDIDLIVYAAPCDSKHSNTNNLKWIKNQSKSEGEEENKYKIGVAHGALSGISPDMTDNYFQMSREELKELNMDLWLLGHTHLPYPEQKSVVNREIYNCGTPEADGLDCSHPGNTWFIEIDDKKSIKAEQIKTGNYRFYDLEYIINSKKDFEKMKSELLDFNPETKIVRIKLSGRVEEDLYNNKEEYYREMRNELAYLKANDNELKIKITDDIIDSEFSKNSFPHKLLSELKDDEKALQLAYEFIREVRG